MDSYLNGTFLGDLADDMGADVSAEGATSALVPATGERQIAQPEYVTLPGGIIMEKKTFMLIVAVLAGGRDLHVHLQEKKDAEE